MADFPTTACEAVRASASARHDGEVATLDAATCDGHAASCSPCRAFIDGLAPLARTTRLREADPVPDLTAQILVAAAAEEAEAEGHRARQARWALGLVGVAQAIVALIAVTTDGGHLGRELAGWELALGVGFAWAAWQPRHAAGLVPTVAVLSAVAVLGALGDLVGGATSLVAEAEHLVEVAGVFLVLAVARDAEPGRGILAPSSR